LELADFYIAMARPKETPVPVPGQGKNISTASQLSQERVSVSSSTSSDNESSSDSHTDSDESDRSDSSSLRDSQDTGTRRQATTAVPPRSRPIYEPPQGFQAPKTHPSSSPTSKFLSPSNLEGKQIWHITAPASVPVSTLKEVSNQEIMNGEAVLSYKGSEYGFVSLDEAIAGSNQAVLLVPSKEGYQLGMLLFCSLRWGLYLIDVSHGVAGTNFSRTILLQQFVRLPLHTNPIEGASQASSALPATTKAARKRPEGLKMRFMPIGVDSPGSAGLGWSSSQDDSDVDGAKALGKGTSANNFRFPNGFTEGRHSEKRKRATPDGDIIAVNTELSPRKKRPKHKTDHKLRPIADALIDLTTPQTKNPHSSQPTPQRPATTPTHDSSGHRRETSQERARRKEKERGRREKAEKSQNNDRHRHSHRHHKERSSSVL
jgi:DNA-directed RNA polymerase I subunit RPA34.5